MVVENIVLETSCVKCGCNFMPPSIDGDDNCASIAAFVRGYAAIVENDGQTSCVLNNIKFSRMICTKCFLTDEDLCRFFNKLDLQVR